MTEKPDAGSTGDKVIKAREDERNRLTRTKPLVTTKLGFDGQFNAAGPLPVLEIRIVGGDPDALTALGVELQSRVIEAMTGLVVRDAS